MSLVRLGDPPEFRRFLMSLRASCETHLPGMDHLLQRRTVLKAPLLKNGFQLI